MDPYFGPTCEVEKSQAPILSLRSFDGLCDTRIKPCHKYMITGIDFMEGNLKCRYRHFTVSVSKSWPNKLLEIVCSLMCVLYINDTNGNTL